MKKNSMDPAGDGEQGWAPPDAFSFVEGLAFVSSVELFVFVFSPVLYLLVRHLHPLYPLVPKYAFHLFFYWLHYS